MIPMMELGCQLWQLEYCEIRRYGISVGGLKVSSSDTKPYRQTWYCSSIVDWRWPRILWTKKSSCRSLCRFVLWGLCFLCVSSRWRCWRPTGVSQSKELECALPFSSIVKTYSRIWSTLKGSVVRGIRSLCLPDICWSAANMPNGDWFT